MPNLEKYHLILQLPLTHRAFQHPVSLELVQTVTAQIVQVKCVSLGLGNLITTKPYSFTNSPDRPQHN